MTYTDFHTHTLPHMDDGAKDAATSIKMLTALASQGVSTVYATPHFYADENSVDEFLKRRERAYQELCEATQNVSDLPAISLGAEIMMCKQLANMELSGLVFKDIPLMLFEFPVKSFEKWFVSLTNRISSANAAIPLIAHIDRYQWTNKASLSEFLKISDVCFQVNCEGLEDKNTLKNICYLLENGAKIVLGSDCHNLSGRRPDFDKATALSANAKVKLDLFGIHSLDTKLFFRAVQHTERNIVPAPQDDSGLVF